MMRYLCLACACVIAASACSTQGGSVPTGGAVVYVAERGWHTDITLPVTEIAGPLSRLEQGFPGVRFFTFGFGERQFLIDRRKSFGAMLNALLPSKSALLLTALRATPAEAYGKQNVVALQVSPAGLERIEAGIWHTFELSSGAELVLLADGPYPGSVFYAASRTYSGLFTCNTWTAEVLQNGGLPLSTTGVLFADQIMGQAHWIASRQTALPSYRPATQ